MKKITFLFILLYGLMACEENKPVIPCLSCNNASTTVPTPGSTVKKVLMEEFTGVRCVNCPKAQLEIKNLQSEDIYGDQLIAVSYHAGFFSNPYPESKFDFRTDAGTEVLNFLNTPLGYPSGVVNRRQFGGQGLQITQFATWGGFVAQALAEDATIALDITTSYSTDNRLLEVSISLTPLVPIADAANLTIMIIEDGISDVQLTPDGIVTDYTQNHVFRTMLTDVLGNPITENLEAGIAIKENFSFPFPIEWEADNCTVIAFVHQSGGAKEVLQVEEEAVNQ